MKRNFKLLRKQQMIKAKPPVLVSYHLCIDDVITPVYKALIKYRNEFRLFTMINVGISGPRRMLWRLIK